MNYCPECGTHLSEHPESTETIADAQVDAVAEVTSGEVRIAEIQASRDITLARITAGIVDAEKDTDLAAAEAKAEVLDDILSPTPAEPEGESDSPVVVVDSPAVDESDAGTDLPPATEAEPREHKSVSHQGFFG